MILRRIFWLLAVISGVVAAAAVPEAIFPGARLLAFCSVAVVVGWLGPFVFSGLARSNRKDAFPAIDSRGADGVVDLATIESVRAEPNSVDARFSRFLALDEDRSAHISKTRAEPGRQCPDLRGRIALVSLFVGRDGRTWSDQAVARSEEAIIRAGTWIEREAIRWSVPVNIEVAATYFLTRDDTDDEVDLELQYEGGSLEATEKGEIAKALASMNRAAIALGFEHARQMIEEIERRLTADVVVWLLQPRRAGRSFAIPVDLSLAGGVNLAVCYPRFADLPEPLVGESAGDPVTIAHELFHLFGASDKYHQPLRAFAAGSVTRRDIMRLTEDRLARLRVDPATAIEIGWDA